MDVDASTPHHYASQALGNASVLALGEQDRMKFSWPQDPQRNPTDEVFRSGRRLDAG
jgi:hypothetical protein